MNINELKKLIENNLLELKDNLEELTVEIDEDSDSVKVALRPNITIDVDYQDYVRQATKNINDITDDIQNYTIRISMEVLNMDEEYQNPNNFFVKDLLTYRNKTLILDEKYTYLFYVKLTEK